MVKPVSVAVPEVASVPVQPPVAVQEVALVDDQVKVTLPLYAMELAEAVKATVGAGGALTATLADCEAVPPVPVQDKL